MRARALVLLGVLALTPALGRAAVTFSIDGESADSPPIDVYGNVPVQLEGSVSAPDTCTGPYWYYVFVLPDGTTYREITAASPCTTPASVSHTFSAFNGARDAVFGYTGMSWIEAFWCALGFCPSIPAANTDTIKVRYRGEAAIAPLASFQISYPSSGSTCAPTTVTVTAIDSNGSAMSSYDGTITLTTSSGHGDWSGVGTINAVANGTADDGIASYTFAPGAAPAGDGGVIQLEFDTEHADDVVVTAADATAGVSASGGALALRDNAFVITATDSLGSVAIAGRGHTMSAQLWRRDATSGDCALATGYTGNHALKAWLGADAAHPATAQAPAVAGIALPSAAPAAANLVLDFTAGEAVFTLDSTDVGKYSLNLRDDGRTFATGVDIEGASTVLTVRPFGLAVDFGAGVDAYSEPAGADASGSAFARAGDAFPVTVTAVAWAVGDDADDDGVPDVGSDLTDNAATPAFGAEGVPEGVAFSGSVVGPIGGFGSLSVQSLGAFSNGSASAALVFDEVGVIDLSVAVADADYLGSGAALGRIYRNVGRFTPHHFAVTVARDGSLGNACPAGGYTYTGQSVSYLVRPQLTITAYNALGVPTRNYTGSFAKLTVDDVSVQAHDDDGTTPERNDLLQFGADSATRLRYTRDVPLAGDVAVLSDDGGGIFTYTFGDDSYAYLKEPLAEVGEFTSAVRLEVTEVRDSDGVLATMLANADPSGVSLRYGRITAQNAYGSELLAHRLPVYTEYFDGARYVPNTEDSCTTLGLADFALSNALVGSPETDGSVPVTGSADTTLTLGDADANPANGYQLSAGDAGASFSAPGAGETGYVDVALGLSALPWLQADWNGDGSADTSIGARVTFGIYRGSDRVIFTREVY